MKEDDEEKIDDTSVSPHVGMADTELTTDHWKKNPGYDPIPEIILLEIYFRL